VSTSSKVVCVFFVLLLTFSAASAFSQNPCTYTDATQCGDIRWPGLTPQVPQPTFPALCTAQVGSNGEPAGVLYALQLGGSFNQSALDTTRLQNAINSCKPLAGAPAVGLELTLNPGSTSCTGSACNAFLSGTLNLPAGVTLIIDPDVTLYALNGSTTIVSIGSNSGTTPTPYTGGAMGYWGIMGYGIIDGQGSGGASKLITSSSSNYLTLYGITMQNPGQMHYIGSGSYLLVDDVKVTAPGDTANTDGIDPSGSSNITIVNSFISDGDDHIAFNASGHVANATIAHNHLYAGHGISIGSYTQGGMENMLVTDVAIDNNGAFGSASKNSLRIKSDDSRGGEVKNILYNGVCVQNGGHVFVFNPYYGEAYGSSNKLYPNFHDVTVQNLNVLNEDNTGHNGASSLEGYNYNGVQRPLYNVTFDNVVFNYTSQQFQNEFYGTEELASEYGINFLNLIMGPDPVSFDASVWLPLNNTYASTVIDNTGGNSNPPYDCTNKFTYLAGELFAAGSTGAPLASLQVNAGSSVTLRAIVQPIVQSAPGFVAPATSGVLTFSDNGQAIVNATVPVSGRITNYVVPGSLVTAGQHVYTVTYSGDSYYLPATASSGIAAVGGAIGDQIPVPPTFPSVTVNVISGTPTTTTVSPSASSLVYGNPVIYTATVTPVSGSATPTGTVIFTDTDGSTVVTSPAETLSGAGVASWTNPLPVAGTHTVTAAYSGASGFFQSSSSAPNSSLYVSQATLTATVTAANLTYNGGTAATISNCTLAGVIAADIGNVTCSATGSFASPGVANGVTVAATVTLSGSAAGNYTVSNPVTTSANITPATPTVAVTCPTSATYNGTAYSCTVTATGVGADGNISSQGAFAWSPAANETAVGAYAMVATFTSGNSNYNNNGSGSATLTIATATPTVTVTCPGATYDGNAHGCTAIATGVGTDGNISSQGSFSWSPAQNETGAGTYSITATFTSGNPNYSSGAQGIGSLVIAKVLVAPGITAIGKTYDGTMGEPIGNVTCSLTPSVSNLNCAATAATFASPNAANGITVTATGITLGGSALANYALSSTSATTTANISPATPAITLTCPGPVTYDGNAHSCTATATGVGGAAVTGTMVITYNGSPAPPSAKATYSVLATFTSGDPNYNNGTPAPGTLSIVAVVPVVTVSCPAPTYDGTPHGCTASATASGSPINGSFAWTPAATEINAGTYLMTGTFTPNDTTDYGVGSQGQGTLIIATAVPTVTVTCAPVTYDGNAHGCTATAAGVMADGNIAGTYGWSPAATETNAGGYTLTATFTSGNTNYSSGAQGTGSLTIAKASVAPSITASGKPFDGTTTEPLNNITCTPVPSVSNLTCSAVAASFASPNVAPSVTVTATGITLGGSAAINYVLSSTSATTTAGITTATPVLTLTCTEVTYDGTPHTCTGAATGIGGAPVTGSFSFSPATITNATAGTTVTGTFTSTNSDYTSGGTATGTLKIDPKPVTPAVAAAGKVYDGTTTATITNCSLTGVVSPDNVTCSAAAANFVSVNAGTGITVNATGITLGGPALSNYMLSSTTAATTANITAITVSASVTAAANKTYDGTVTEPVGNITCATTPVVANLACAPAAATFATPGVGNGITVTATGITLGGSVAGGYVLSNTTAAATANINQKAASVAANAASKVFGSVDPALSATLTGFVASDNVTATCTRAVGEVVGLYAINCTAAPAGALANYTVTYTPANFTIFAATPTISQLAPPLVEAGAADFTLTVTGTNFQSNAIVRWNGTALSTTWVSGTVLTAAVPATDVTAMGTASVTVFNPLPSPGAPSKVFTFAIDSSSSTAGTITVTGPPVSTTLSVTSSTGGIVNVPVTVGGANATALITAVCYNLPAGATCSYANGTVSISVLKGTPLGTYAVTIVFTTTQAVASNFLHGPAFFAAWSGILGLPLGLLWMGGNRKKNLRRLLMILAGMVLLISLVGCGGKASSTATPTTTQTSTAVMVSVQ